MLIEVLPEGEEQKFPSLILSGPFNAEEEKRFRRFAEETILKERFFSYVKGIFSEKQIIFFETKTPLENMALACTKALEKEGHIRQYQYFFREIMERIERTRRRI